MLTADPGDFGAGGKLLEDFRDRNSGSSITCPRNLLYAFTFDSAHLGAIHFIARAVPPTLSATAQSLYSAVVMGLGLGLMLLASGWLYAAYAGAAYYPMAATGLLGGVLAWTLARQRPAEG